MTYVLIRSWHIVEQTSRSGVVKTRCGRSVVPTATTEGRDGAPVRAYPLSDELPLGDKSCETCLRLSRYRSDW